jgi:hypothetical protein
MTQLKKIINNVQKSKIIIFNGFNTNNVIIIS